MTNTIEIIDYEEAIKIEGNKHLLLGNGFSMAFDYERFNFKTLFEEAQLGDMEKLLIGKLKTEPDFEETMYLVHSAKIIMESFATDIPDEIAEFEESLRLGLKRAVHNVHTKDDGSFITDFTLEQIHAVHSFLGPFLFSGNTVFTINYDLLLYRSFMEIKKLDKTVDKGWGDNFLNPRPMNTATDQNCKDKKYYIPLTENWCNCRPLFDVRFLHGALHIFEDALGNSYKCMSKTIPGSTTGGKILNVIEERISNKDFPLTVTEGTSDNKLSKIFGNEYLRECYECLESITGSIFIIGSSLHENDGHLWKALDSNKELNNIYIGCYGLNNFNELSKKVNKSFTSVGNIEKVKLFDTATLKIWESEKDPCDF